jgi:hypothetical protein
MKVILEPFEALSEEVESALGDEVADLARFLDLDVQLQSWAQPRN